MYVCKRYPVFTALTIIVYQGSLEVAEKEEEEEKEEDAAASEK
jgi:hypothetical protein